MADGGFAGNHWGNIYGDPQLCKAVAMIKQVPGTSGFDSWLNSFGGKDALLLAFGGLVLAVLLLVTIFRLVRRLRNKSSRDDRAWRPPMRNLRPWKPRVVVPFKPVEPERPSEIKRVLGAEFTKKRIMNHSEYQLFLQLDAMFRDRPGGYRLFPQVPLGGLIDSQDRDAYFGVMHKRCDFVIVANSGEPAAVIEYQGHGHFQGNSAQRDEVKRIALKKAGVPTIEVIPDYQWPQVEREILKELGLHGD